MSAKVRAILKEPGWTQVKLASALGVSQSTVNRWLNGSEPEGKSRDAINDLHDSIFGHPDAKMVPLKGRVGAGQAILAIDNGDADFVEAPPSSRAATTIAVEVEGDSMYPAYESRTILYYSKLLPPADMVNRRAVVKLGDGRMLVKVLRPGSTPQTWTLQSINALYPDIIDEVVEWAAPIDWTKPRY